MTADHEASAAYVLGALSLAERQVFEAHLENCERCQRDVVDFAPLPGLLAQADLTQEPPTIDVAEALIRRVGSDLERTMASRNRWRMAAAAAATAAAVLIGVMVMGSEEQPSFSGGPVTELVVDDAAGISGTMTVSERDWGSRLDIDLFDVPARDRYLLWAVGTDGSWDVAASWAWAESGTCRIAGATRFQADSIDHLVVTSADKQDILVEST